jgi:hypothetical protein
MPGSVMILLSENSPDPPSIDSAVAKPIRPPHLRCHRPDSFALAQYRDLIPPAVVIWPFGSELHPV